MFKGWYNNTAKTLSATDIAWMVANKINPQGWDYNTFYDNGSLLANKGFPAFVKSCYSQKILCGIPWSGDSEVNAAIAYNKSRTDSRERLTHMVSEIEDYGAGLTLPKPTTPAYFKAALENNYVKAKGAGIRFGVYNGWTKQWDVVVKNSDFLLLHCYIPSSRMSDPKAIYDYICGSKNDGRLALIAAEAKKQGKIYPVSIIFSCEPDFGQTYFKSNGWNAPYALFLAEFAKRANATMKSNVIIDGDYHFVTKYGKLSKPYVVPTTTAVKTVPRLAVNANAGKTTANKLSAVKPVRRTKK